MAFPKRAKRVKKQICKTSKNNKVMADIKAIAEELVNLTVKEVKELTS